MGPGKKPRGNRFALSVVLVSVALAVPAAAQPAGQAPAAEPPPSAAFPPPSAVLPSAAPPPVAPIMPAPPNAVWRDRYLRARQKLLDGHFAVAQSELVQLARTAQDPLDRAMAAELAGLAASWNARGLVFVRRQDLGEGTLSAKAANERTTDEIAVLYLNAVLYGIGTGAWLATLTEPESAAAGILPALALAGAAAGGVALADTSQPFRYGVPQTIVTGMTIGLEQGLVWTLWNHARVESADEWEGSTIATVIWGSATAGAIIGGVIGHSAGTTPGRASFVGSAALWGGLVSGLTIGAVSKEDDFQDDRALFAAAIGLNASAIGGALAAGDVSPSIARVRFLDLGGIAGALLGGGLYLSFAGDDSEARPLLGSLSLGIASGLVVAWFATGSMERDHGVEGRPESSPIALRIQPSVMPVNGGAALGFVGSL
jgi:hypothetical protein